MRTWPGLAALGAGIIHLGIAAASPPLLLALLAVTGAAEVGWGVVALARQATPAPRGALVTAAALVALWVLALLLPAAAAHHAGGTRSTLPIGPAAGAALLDLTVASLLALSLRRRGPGNDGSAGFLIAAAAAAAVVAGITVASLAGTSVGTVHTH